MSPGVPLLSLRLLRVHRSGRRTASYSACKRSELGGTVSRALPGGPAGTDGRIATRVQPPHALAICPLPPPGSSTSRTSRSAMPRLTSTPRHTSRPHACSFRQRCPSRDARGDACGAATAGLCDGGGADLVVVTTRGQGGTRRVLMGSVADRIVRLGPTVLLVPTPDAGEEETSSAAAAAASAARS